MMQAYNSGRLLVRLARAFGQVSHSTCRQATSSAGTAGIAPEFDVSVLEVLVCPLSKGPLRWDAQTSELICDELSVAYPVVNGIPNLRPADGRVIEMGEKEMSTNQEAWGNADASQSPGSGSAPG
ncbi:g3859 [Coccomyxa viridis]|uniref:Protein preY, mitochondrial n=1 Tax=Coccomyxa viridis TaxID=1274662 RepID=A0ABP1FNT4_9CHLO